MGGNSYIGALPPVKTLAGLSGSASISGKQLTLSVVNPHLTKPVTTEIAVRGSAISSVAGQVLASHDIHDHNDFDHPNAVMAAAAELGLPTLGKLRHTFPPASVTTLTLTLS